MPDNPVGPSKLESAECGKPRILWVAKQKDPNNDRCIDVIKTTSSISCGMALPTDAGYYIHL